MTPIEEGKIMEKLGCIEGKLDGINAWMINKEKSCDAHWLKTNTSTNWINQRTGEIALMKWAISILSGGIILMLIWILKIYTEHYSK